VLEFLIDAGFILSVAFIWFMIAYQFVLTLAGFLHYFDSRREKGKIDTLLEDGKLELPSVTILVPAHNEEKVIKGTVLSILGMEYPIEKMELMVLNDCSEDKTGEILEEIRQTEPRLRIINVPKEEGGRGKSAALNYGLKYATGELIAIYDADNQPEKSALKYLGANLALHPELGAAEGMFRCRNRYVNLLTRFINIEGVAFQWIVQSGRWKMLKISTLPGTNFVMRKDLIQQLGGWDESALTEDSELSIRIYQADKRIKFIPYSATWEQEPQSLAVWFRQRTRWVRGNNYVLGKFLREIPRFKSKVLALEVLYSLSLYYIFLGAVFFSDLVFLLGLTGIWKITLLGPFSQVWALGYLLFILEVFLALSFEEEDKPGNFFLVLLSYFTYCQAWLLVVLSAFWQDLRKTKRSWQKTERF